MKEEMMFKKGDRVKLTDAAKVCGVNSRSAYGTVVKNQQGVNVAVTVDGNKGHDYYSEKF